jgi:7-cyano-7-deazaguanine synthase in queuosine biosynthesis
MAPIVNTVLLMSGGVDSVAAWVILGYPPTLHFRFATPYAAIEERSYRRLVTLAGSPWQITDALKDLAPLGRGGKAEELPLRNLLMCNIAWALGYDEVVLAQATDWAPDKRWLFAHAAGWTARRSLGARRKLRVARPFALWSKARLIREAIARGHLWWLDHLYSCYTGEEDPCGNCHACRRAAIAFAAADYVPPYTSWIIPAGACASWRIFMQWVRHEGPLWLTPGAACYLPIRLLELRQAFKNTRRGYYDR